jgi:4-aminobutyrate aminotransferase-like enzyme
MGVGGFITPPDEYFQVVGKIVHNYGGKYISDEVQTGAGRCGGTYLLTKSIKIDADMVTMAKGLGNGAAVGGVLMKTDTAEKMAGKLYFNTFAGDPYQMTQVSATIDTIREEKLADNAVRMGKLLQDGLKELMKKHTLVGDVRGRGLLLGFELVKDRTSKAPATEETGALLDACKARGLLLGKGGLLGNVVRVAPPLALNKEQVAFMLETIDQALAEISKKA